MVMKLKKYEDAPLDGSPFLIKRVTNNGMEYLDAVFFDFDPENLSEAGFVFCDENRFDHPVPLPFEWVPIPEIEGLDAYVVAQRNV